MNKELQTLLSHRSYREYSNRAVEDEKLDLIIRAVQAAPNWCNIQHVSVIAIKDLERRKRMAKLCNNQQHIIQAPLFLVFCADYYRVDLAFQQASKDLTPIMQDIDHLIIGSNEAGIALGTAVISAELLGLGTVPIGDVRMNPLAMIEELKLPKYVLPLLGLCIGYPTEIPELKPRLPKDAIYFEEYYNQNIGGLIAPYDDTYKQYLATRQSNNRLDNWTQFINDFYQYPYNHYPKIAEMLKKQGFWSQNEKKHS